MYATKYTKTRQRFACALTAIFALSIMMMLILATTASAAETRPVIEYKITNTTGSTPTDNANCYTVETGDTVTFELDITNLTNPEMITLFSNDALQFQEILEMTAIDQNNQAVPWEYNNSVPIDNKIEINTMGLPDNIYRLNVVYTSTVLQSEQLAENGVFGEAMYLDDGTTYSVSSADMLYALNFKLTVVDSSKNAETENFLDTGSYSLYYNSAMTRPVNFVKTGNTYQVVPEWDNRGENHINIENSGTSTITGLRSGVYYLTQTTAPDNYDANIGVVELELTARKAGSSVTTNVRILNDTDVALTKTTLTTNANSLSIDYARANTFANQLRNTAAKSAAPMLMLFCAGVAGVAIIMTKRGKIAHHGRH